MKKKKKCKFRASDELKTKQLALLRNCDDLYSCLTAASPNAVLVASADLKILIANSQAAAITGYKSPKEMIGMSALKFVVPADVPRILADAKKILKVGTLKNREYAFVRKDGTRFIGELSASVILDDAGRPKAFVAEAKDITERKKVEEELRQSEGKFRLTFENSKDAIFWADLKTGLIINCNKSAERLLERRKKDIIGKHQTTLHPPEKRKYYAQLFKKHTKSKLASGIEAEIVTKTGRIKPVHIASNVTLIGKKSIIQGVFRDIAQRKKIEREREILNKELTKSNRRLKELSLVDSQTDLFNHRYFEDAIEREFQRAKRDSHCLSVIMLDLDYFKSINDVYGHKFGDLVIKQFAKLLKKTMRRYDIPVRFGGEEFIVISPETSRAQALILARRIFDSVRSSDFGDKKNKIQLKLSVAVSCYPADRITKGMDLVEVADRILNKAKEDGANRIYSTLDTGRKDELPLLPEMEDEKDDIDFLKSKIAKLTKQTNQSLIESVFAFARAIKLKDSYTGDHTESTVSYVSVISREAGLTREDTESVKRAAILHDLGKIGISESILLKKSRLTEEEFGEIKRHPAIAADIIRPIHFLHDLIPFILHHHERWDGTGYPDGLSGEEIPLGARIIAIADVFHALISDRPYRKAFPKREAIEIITDGSGTQFDPRIVNLFLKATYNGEDIQ